MVQFRWGATTNPGLVRNENEDTFIAEPMVFAVADGMGGHQAGEVASALAASILRDRFRAGATSEDAAAAAVGEANAAIYGAARANAAQTGMGTTLTVLAVLTSEGEGDRLVVLNVGDSRTYRFRAGRLQRVTVDHSYVQELVATGHISVEEARTHPRRNIVTRALGIEPTVRADLWTLPIVRGDRFVLCSDGLVDEVPEDEILDLVAAVEDPQTLSEQLVAIANRHGGRDNVTVVIVDVLEGEDPPDPTDEISIDPTWAEGIQDPPLWGDDPPAPAEVSSGGEVSGEEPTDDDITVVDHSAMPTVPAPVAPLPIPLVAPLPTLPARESIPTAPSDAPEPAHKERNPIAPRPKRRFTGGMFLFAFMLAAIITVTFTLFALHVRSGYFVGFNRDTVVVYKGQSERVLWFSPTINQTSTKHRAELAPTMAKVIEGKPRFDSAEQAAKFIDEQVIPTTTPTTPATTAPATTTTTAAGATTTTIASGP